MTDSSNTYKVTAYRINTRSYPNLTKEARKAFPNQLTERFREVGICHIYALSKSVSDELQSWLKMNAPEVTPERIDLNEANFTGRPKAPRDMRN